MSLDEMAKRAYECVDLSVVGVELRRSVPERPEGLRHARRVLASPLPFSFSTERRHAL